MTAQEIATVSAAVVALTQLLKWAGVLNDERGPLGVLVFAAIGVTLWGYSVGTFTRTLLFDYFSAWIVVSCAAAGVFGFTRSGPAAITSTKAPPAGAGASPTE